MAQMALRLDLLPVITGVDQARLLPVSSTDPMSNLKERTSFIVLERSVEKLVERLLEPHADYSLKARASCEEPTR